MKNENQSLENIASASQEILANIEEISSRLSISHESAEQNKSTYFKFLNDVTDIKDHFTELNKKTDNLETIDNIIKDITSQTHLLSLNATIEAGRAGGEYGRTFTVVAEEMRKLADKNKENVVKIKTIIDEIHNIIKKINPDINDIHNSTIKLLKENDERTENIEGLKNSANEVALATESLANDISLLAQ